MGQQHCCFQPVTPARSHAYTLTHVLTHSSQQGWAGAWGLSAQHGELVPEAPHVGSSASRWRSAGWSWPCHLQHRTLRSPQAAIALAVGQRAESRALDTAAREACVRATGDPQVQPDCWPQLGLPPSSSSPACMPPSRMYLAPVCL